MERGEPETRAVEDETIATLRQLNEDYIAAVQTSNVRRFEEILADDFLNTNPDGSLVDRAGFLAQDRSPRWNLRAQGARRAYPPLRRRWDRSCAYDLHEAGRAAGRRSLYRCVGVRGRPLALRRRARHPRLKDSAVHMRASRPARVISSSSARWTTPPCATGATSGQS